MDDACKYYKSAPGIDKAEAATEVRNEMVALKESGNVTKWGIVTDEELSSRRSIGLGELRLIGVKNPEALASVSVRNEAAFLFSVVASTSILAVILGQLPGDWGFFGAYLTGGITLAVLAIGSINPSILQFFIDKFSQVFPDYRERVLRHEAAHMLVAILLGVPATGYSLSLGKEHVDLAEAALQRRLIAQQLTDEEVDRLAVIAMAGATSECMKYDEVIGQTADFMDLQRIMNRAQNKLSNAQQQNLTRWAAYQAATLLKRYSKEYEALQQAMNRGASVAECVRAIEEA